MSRLSIGTQVALLLIVALLLVLGASFALQYRVNSQNLDNLSRSGALNVFSSAHTSMADSLEKGDMEVFDRMMQTLSQVNGIHTARLLNSDGTVAYQAGQEKIDAPLTADMLARVNAAGEPLIVEGSSVMDIYQPDKVTADCVRCHSTWKLGSTGAILNIRYSTDDLVQARQQYLQNSLLALVVTALALALTLVFALRRMVVRPIQIMAAASDRIAQGDLAQIFRRIDAISSGDLAQEAFASTAEEVEVATAAEITSMSRALNAMIGRLREVGGAYERMVGYLGEMAGAAAQIADGDLSVAVAPQDERDVLGNAFERMLDSLRQLIGRVQESADQVAASSNGISTASTQSAQAAQQVAQTIEQVSQGATQQTQSVMQATSQAGEMVRAIDNIQQGARDQMVAIERSSLGVDQIVRAVGQSSQAARGGADTVGRALEALLVIKERVEGAGSKVSEMQASSARIGKIVSTIDYLADQTNLLSLNAAIEAARAGEQGRGFAVVADEVRKLAEQSSQATREISEIIRGVERGTRETAEAVQASLGQVAAGSSLAGEATQALRQIVDSAGQMATMSAELAGIMRGVKEVAERNTAAAEMLSSSSGAISRAMDDVASVSEENSASAQEVTAMAEELGAQSQDVTASAQRLSELAAGLQEALRGFRVSDEPGAQAANDPLPRLGAGAFRK
jgi:methyl-accepting chemotaxis protein